MSGFFMQSKYVTHIDLSKMLNMLHLLNNLMQERSIFEIVNLTMKRINIFSLVALSFFSCGDDDVSKKDSVKGGVYKQISYEITVPLDLNNDGILSTNLLEENGAVLSPQQITFGLDNTVIPPYPITTCVDDDGNGHLNEFICLVVVNYVNPPSYVQTERTVTIDNSIVGLLSEDRDTLRFEETLTRDLLNNAPTGGFDDTMAISTYVRE